MVGKLVRSVLRSKLREVQYACSLWREVLDVQLHDRIHRDNGEC